MATIYNSDLSKELQAGAKIQQNVDVIPNQLAEKVVPVMEVNPKFFRLTNVYKQVSFTASAGGTVYSTPADKSFYLTSITLQNLSDVNADNTFFQFQFYPEGMAGVILARYKPTFTAYNDYIQIYFDIPIKMARDVTLTASSTFTVGTSRTTATITGYTVDD